MMELESQELINMVKSVFQPKAKDKNLCIIVDVPKTSERDNNDWKLRREITFDWYLKLKENKGELMLDNVVLAAYGDVGSNNADLPEFCFLVEDELPDIFDEKEYPGKRELFSNLFSSYQLFLAPTENSTTAPMKNAAKEFNFRAATMPGFAPSMIPALRIDYSEVGRRVSLIKEKLDPAIRAEVNFTVDTDKTYVVNFDLRFRKAHESAGRFPLDGVAGNFPSGETYIVPYEGEQGEKSLTKGILPVQCNDEVVLFEIEENNALRVITHGKESEREALHLKTEPAYGNMAELGFGVLGDFGLDPTGEILLDEKLGFHVAFGRSDHFGGNIGPSDFSSPQAVIHLDRVYIKAMQNRIEVASLILHYPDKESEEIIKNGVYTVF